MNYLQIYYLILAASLFIWVITYCIGYLMPVEHDSMGDVINNDRYKKRQTILLVGFISMWVFIIGILLVFYTIYMIVPSSKEERSEKLDLLLGKHIVSTQEPNITPSLSTSPSSSTSPNPTPSPTPSPQ